MDCLLAIVECSTSSKELGIMLIRFIVISLAGMILGAVSVQQKDEPNRSRPASSQKASDEPQDRIQRDGGGLNDERASGQNTDQIIASSIAILCQEEMAAAKIGHQNLHSEKAKAFAVTIMEQHLAYLRKLDSFALDAALEAIDREQFPTEVEIQATPNREGIERAAVKVTDKERSPERTSETPEKGVDQDKQLPSNVGVLQIQREIARECLNALETALQEKQGVEADQYFVGHQIAKHGAMQVQLAVLQRHVSPELATVFAEGETRARKLKGEAEDLMQELASTGAATARGIPSPETQKNQSSEK